MRDGRRLLAPKSRKLSARHRFGRPGGAHGAQPEAQPAQGPHIRRMRAAQQRINIIINKCCFRSIGQSIFNQFASNFPIHFSNQAKTIKYPSTGFWRPLPRPHIHLKRFGGPLREIVARSPPRAAAHTLGGQQKLIFWCAHARAFLPARRFCGGRYFHWFFVPATEMFSRYLRGIAHHIFGEHETIRKSQRNV